MAITTTANYILNASNNLLDLRLKYGTTLSLAGQKAVVTGGSGVDYVYASAGTSVDFTQGGGGADMLYLDGAFVSYTKSVSGSVVTLSNLAGDTYTMDSGAGQKFVFANGSITAADLVNSLSALNPAETSLTLPTATTTAPVRARAATTRRRR